ncbi:MAG: hypothetical protein KDA32_14375, partial [Phycisphaerales bacterium]|nr:hypothetical protein [Phycisphaerales bacterium]
PPARNPGIDGLINTPDDILASPGVIRSDELNAFIGDDVFGFNPQITGRSAPTMINAAFGNDLFWDGRARSQFVDPQTGNVAIPVGGGLESQIVQPPVSDVEMAHQDRDWQQIAQKLRRSRPLDLSTNIPPDVAAELTGDPGYPELFTRAFGDPGINSRRIAFAIATYERTLISDQTPFDAFRAGVPNAMTPQQVQGFNAFQTSNCSVCHAIAQDLFTGQGFRNIGLRPPTEDIGRQIVTGDPADRGKFKVPTLRNVGLKRSFMHNGQFQNLGQVIGFYARAPGAAPQFADNQDPVMATVNVPPPAAQVIIDFLSNALTDPRVAAETFPFDRPTMFMQRPGDRPTLVGGGRPGTGGVLPVMIVDAPGLIGSFDHRVGVRDALAGAPATLVFSLTEPTGADVAMDEVVGQMDIDGDGLATMQWPLVPGQFADGDVLFAQWRIDDPAATDGVALSAIARIPVFCGSSGCAPECLGDVNGDRTVNLQDLSAFLGSFGKTGDASWIDGDFDGDKDVDLADLAAILSVFGAICG